jgi:hypothetical protein
MSLITMTQQVCRRIGITAPVSVSSSSDPQIIQLMAIANEEGQDLSARYPWQSLQNESTFVTVAAESQGAITTLAGSGFRYILNDIMWDRTLLVPVSGPLNPQDWQGLKARNITGPYSQFRIRGGLVRFIPTPVAGNTIAFEWISKNWVTVTALATTSATWTADADTGLLDEEIMTQGVIWRWKAAKGLEYAEDYNKYERLVADQMARDGGKPRLNLGGGMSNFPAGVFVPSGSWSV